MQKKLNEDFIDEYCEKFVTKVSNNFFVDGKEVITGKEILEITPSKQVNFFIIKLLFRYWQEETKKLKSPFFNYKNEEVKQAMIQFMNILSQHIEIQQSKFTVLLNHALKDTIYLVVVPDAYIEIDLESRGVEEIKEKSIEGTVKYLKIHKKEISDFLNDMKGLTIDDVIDELPDEFDTFDTREAVVEECKQLSKVLTLDPEKLMSEDPDIDDFDEFDDEEEDILEPGEEDIVVDKPAKPKKVAPDMLPEENIVMSENDSEMAVEDFSDDQTAGFELPEVENISTTEDSFDNEAEEEAMQEESFEDDFETTKDVKSEEEEDNFPEETLNDKFETKEKTVAEHHEMEKNSEILKSISVSNRYMFIRDLFKDNKDEFEHCLFELEKQTSFDDSVEFLVQGYAKDNNWDMQSEVVKEFLKVLFRRFR